MHTRPVAELRAEYAQMLTYVEQHLAQGQDPQKWILNQMPDYLKRAGFSYRTIYHVVQEQTAEVREVLEPIMDMARDVITQDILEVLRELKAAHEGQPKTKAITENSSEKTSPQLPFAPPVKEPSAPPKSNLKLRAKAIRAKLDLVNLGHLLNGYGGLGYLGSLKEKFGPLIQLHRTKITTRPDLFQGRQVAYSQETLDKIMREGFDKSQEPISVWKDPATGQFVVISGHSRWQASELLYKKGDKKLESMPVKIFNGNLEEAQDYAILESNRSGTAEGLKSDLAAYKRAISKGKNKDYLLSIFKTEARLRLLQDLSYLNPKGRFLEYLGEDSEKSFPYLQRNAQWVGILRKLYTMLTDSHEREMFEYLYDSKSGLNVKKENFFNLVEKKVSRMGFSPTEPLNLYNVVSTHAVTESAQALIEQVQREIDDLVSQRQTKEANIARARNEGKDHLVNRFLEERGLLNAAILRKVEEKDRLERQKRELERSTQFDLFSASQPALAVNPPQDERVRLLKLKAKAVRVKVEMG